MRKILYIDDEAINLTLFSLNFQSEFDVITAQSPFEALKLIEDENVSVILTDYKMPEMNGIELIDKIKEMNSNAVCMVLSGFMESDVVDDRTKIFKYITKPYDSVELRGHLREALKLVS